MVEVIGIDLMGQIRRFRGERSEPAGGWGWWGGGRDIVCNHLRWGKPYKRF